MTAITVHGPLAKALGRSTWNIKLTRPREAMAALEANTGGRLYRFLRRHTNIEYRVLVNGKEVERPVANDPSIPSLAFWLAGEYQTIDIVPVPAGSGWLQTLIGVALIVVGVIVGVATGWTGVGYWAGAYLIGIGASMVIGGIIGLLSPQPTLGGGTGSRGFSPVSNDLQQQEESGSRKLTSYLFSGAVNTTQQGNPVQVVYGESIIGSHLISVRISNAASGNGAIGGPKPGSYPTPIFEALPLWDRLEDNDLADVVKDLSDLQNNQDGGGLSDNSIRKKADQMHLFDGDVDMGASNLRHLLIYLHYLFHGPTRSVIPRKNAKKLYRALDLSSVSNPDSATAQTLLIAVGNFYDHL